MHSVPCGGFGLIEFLLANWVAVAVFHFCTHELPMIGAAGYFVYRYFWPKPPEEIEYKWVNVPEPEDCCDHECAGAPPL